MKKFYVFIGFLLFLGFVVFLVIQSMARKQEKEIALLKIEPINLIYVEDGIYYGETDTTFVKVKVNVEVRDHKIIKIELLEHQNGFGKNGESVISEMEKNNSIDVSNVSGATNSSIAIRYAVAEALKKGLRSDIE